MFFSLSAIIAEFTVVVLDGSKTGPRLICFHAAIPILCCTRNKCRYHARLNKYINSALRMGIFLGEYSQCKFRTRTFLSRSRRQPFYRFPSYFLPLSTLIIPAPAGSHSDLIPLRPETSKLAAVYVAAGRVDHSHSDKKWSYAK